MGCAAAARALQKLGVEAEANDPVCAVHRRRTGFGRIEGLREGASGRTGKISGVLVHDSGTGKVLTVGLMGNYAARETVDHALYPLGRAKEVGLAEPTLRTEGGSDHVPFDEAGVPGFWCVQDLWTTTRAPLAGGHHRASALGRI